MPGSFFYHEGLGVAPDMEKSFYWTLRAAERGDWDAYFVATETKSLASGRSPGASG